ncbi:MAG: arsenic efflux protein [Thermaerobacter sp.]|nr:arsenic efflux protein [Thermaerobacter sp.]
MAPTISLLLGAIRDTLLTVAAPVVILLFLIAYAEESGLLDFERIFRRTGKAQPALGAVVSAVPGCAGSVTLTRLYSTGAVGIGTLYAAHFATLGDAAFILWSARPLTTLALTGISVLVGIVIGSIIQLTPARRYFAAHDLAASCDLPMRLPDWAVYGWFIVLLVALSAALLLPSPAPAAGIFGALLAIISVVLLRLPRKDGLHAAAPARALQRTARDAAEIMAWVVLADVAFTLANGLLGGILVQALHGNVLLDVVIAAGIGLIPGCGPQIVVASLYVAGDLPFAALVANTISQHGDAIFPLLGVQRRVAAYLTIAGGAVGLVAGVAAALIVH